MRRGQMEMVGLVFIVVIVIFGVLVYTKISANSNRPNGVAMSTKDTQAGLSFLVALKETTIPACGADVETVAVACVEGHALCPYSDPCGALTTAFKQITDETLTLQGVHFNLSLEGTNAQAANDCQSSNATTLRAAPAVPIVLSGGGDQGRLVLSLCR